jgi:hypothetical protein
MVGVRTGVLGFRLVIHSVVPLFGMIPVGSYTVRREGSVGTGERHRYS